MPFGQITQLDKAIHSTRLVTVLSYFVVPFSVAQIRTIVSFSETQIYRIAKRAKDRGWDPETNPALRVREC